MKEQKESIKKSAIDLTGLALAVVVMGITLTVGVVILGNMRDNQVTNLDVTTVTNESLTTVDGAGEALAQAYFKGITGVVNATGGQTIPTSNYSVTYDTASGYARIASTGSHPYNNTNWKVTYQIYNKSDQRYALPDNATTGLLEYGNWFDIIVIVGVAAVIIALIFMAFGNKGVETAGVGY